MHSNCICIVVVNRYSKAGAALVNTISSFRMKNLNNAKSVNRKTRPKIINMEEHVSISLNKI